MFSNTLYLFCTHVIFEIYVRFRYCFQNLFLIIFDNVTYFDYDLPILSKEYFCKENFLFSFHIDKRKKSLNIVTSDIR